MKKIIIYFCCFILTGCSGSEPVAQETIPVDDKMVNNANICNVYESSNWQAAVKKNDAGNLNLKVTGDVVMPTPGYKIEWNRGPMDRRQPPSLRLILKATPPAGVASIQVLTQQNVEFIMDSPVPKYRSIIILCGDKKLSEIQDVALVN